MNPPPSLAAPKETASSNLAFALRCLPVSRRHNAMVFYRFCRAVDDIADDVQLPADQKREALTGWKDALKSGTLLPEELRQCIEEAGISHDLLLAIVEGCEMDIEPQPFENLEALRAYCWKVACAVGLVSLGIFGCQRPESIGYAGSLGYALQFTNILRDVAEDASMGRVYLPCDLLAHFQVSKNSLHDRKPSGDFSGLMHCFASLAEHEFRKASGFLTREDANALLPAEIMAAIYSKLLLTMKSDGFRVFQRRYSLSKFSKVSLALGTMCRIRFSKA